MKLLIVLASFTITVISSYSIPDPVSGTTCIYNPEDVKYLFYNIQNPATAIIIPSNNFTGIKNTHFDKSKPTLFLVHGGGGDTTGPLTQNVRAFTVANKIDINLIAVDWLGFQKTWKKRNITDYYNSCAPLFGKVVSGFITELAQKHGLNYNDLSMAGHSLASRFCFEILKDLPKPIKHFMGLESCVVAGMKANFTECIFTNRGDIAGRGMVNYFPNGGTNQPGCPKSPEWVCSHWRSVDLYAESLASNKFVAKKCDSYKNYKAGKCAKNVNGIMGGLNPDMKQRGHYYLETNAKSLYAKG